MYKLSFEEFDFRVSLDENGEAWCSFHESGKCAFTLSLDDLRIAARFAKAHVEVENP